MSRSETRFSTTAESAPGRVVAYTPATRRSPNARAWAGSVTSSGLSVFDSSLNTPTTRNAARRLVAPMVRTVCPTFTPWSSA